MPAMNERETTRQGKDQRVAAGQLALEMMHEIRNPLEALGHLTFLTLEERHNPDQVEKYMLLAKEQMRTLNRIAGQTLGFARVSEQPKPVDLVGLAEAALRIHQRTVTAKRIHLVKELPTGLIAEVRSGQILQVLSNLIANALYALPKEGKLSFRLRRRKDRIDLTIADNGHGIRTEHLSRIFEPFFSTKEEAGNGLGLPLSRRIIEDHGGTIRMRSSVQAHRAGTCFRISLPFGGIDPDDPGT